MKLKRNGSCFGVLSGVGIEHEKGTRAESNSRFFLVLSQLPKFIHNMMKHAKPRSIPFRTQNRTQDNEKLPLFCWLKIIFSLRTPKKLERCWLVASNSRAPLRNGARTTRSQSVAVLYQIYVIILFATGNSYIHSLYIEHYI